MDRAVEEGKKAFAGYELAGQTLGVIGLGKVGCLVADAAIKLGMNVLGYDPGHHRRRRVEPAGQCEEGAQRLRGAAQRHFVSLHVPLVDATRDLVGPTTSADAAGAVLLNFSREGVVQRRAVLAALERGTLGCYVCDFPSAAILRHERSSRCRTSARRHARRRRTAR
jgi:D-3-phosphoglycerate dehydrogenase